MNVTLNEIFLKVISFFKDFIYGATTIDNDYNFFQCIGVTVLRFFYILLFDIISLFNSILFLNKKHDKNLLFFIFEESILIYIFPVLFFIFYGLKLFFYFFYYTLRYFFIIIFLLIDIVNHLNSSFDSLTFFKFINSLWINLDAWFSKKKTYFQVSSFQFYLLLMFYLIFFLLLDFYLYPYLISKTVKLIEKTTDRLLYIIKFIQRSIWIIEYTRDFIVIPYFLSWSKKQKKLFRQILFDKYFRLIYFFISNFFVNIFFFIIFFFKNLYLYISYFFFISIKFFRRFIFIVILPLKDLVFLHPSITFVFIYKSLYNCFFFLSKIISNFYDFLKPFIFIIFSFFFNDKKYFRKILYFIFIYFYILLQGLYILFLKLQLFIILYKENTKKNISIFISLIYIFLINIFYIIYFVYIFLKYRKYLKNILYLDILSYLNILNYYFDIKYALLKNTSLYKIFMKLFIYFYYYIKNLLYN